MIIGVDGNEANIALRVGVSVYTLNLLKYFKKQANKNLQFRIFLRQKPLTNLPSSNSYFIYEVVPGKFFWSQIFLPLQLYQKKDIDIFFSPAHYLPRFCPVPSIVTIHDLSYLYYPDDFLQSDLYKLMNWTKYSVKKAKKIIAVSKTTKKDIIKQYGVSEKKIEIVYNGYEKKLGDRTSEVKEERSDGETSEVKLRKWRIKKQNYILYVGTIQPRKNLSTLITAFGRFIKFYPHFKLIIAGKKGWLYEKIFQQVGSLGLKNKIVFTDYVNDQQLVSFYKNAFCFVLPSLYEGFGIPILEAMSFGCPVISSSASSLPEVGGDSCLYFDPQNADDLLEKMKLLKEDDESRKELIEKGRERIKKFSWETCGKKTLEVIKNVAKL